MYIDELINSIWQKSDYSELFQETDAWVKCKAKKGSSCPIYISGYREITIKAKNLTDIIRLYIEGKIRDCDLDYILSGLLILYHSDQLVFDSQTEGLSESFFDVLFDLTEPVINGEITKERAESAIDMLAKLTE